MHKADNLPPSCAVVTKSGNLDFLEPSGQLQACNETALRAQYLRVFITCIYYVCPTCFAVPHTVIRENSHSHYSKPPAVTPLLSKVNTLVASRNIKGTTVLLLDSQYCIQWLDYVLCSTVLYVKKLRSP